jgi:hypothetical protein
MKYKKQIKMGNSCHFAECLHSAKSEESLPSVRSTALGKEAIWHSAKKQSLLSARSMALGKDFFFAECQVLGTRQSNNLCRVPQRRRSAKIISLPSAVDLALGKPSVMSLLRHGA